MRFKVSTAVIFLDSLMLEDEGTTTSKTSGTTHPMTQCHITKDLNAQNIEWRFKSLIESYLTCRYQKVTLEVNNTNITSSSKWELIKNGVPQSSILGLLFFLLYINDLPKTIDKNNSLALFADNTSLLITDSSNLGFNTNINQSFCNLISWFNNNLLTSNFTKTHYVEFRTKNYYQVKTKVKCERKNILNSTEIKF
jgi:ABC-type microcin C transport system permease subunit YejB